MPTLAEETKAIFSVNHNRMLGHDEGMTQAPMTGDRVMVKFTIYKAGNGKIIEMGTYKPQARGPDWEWEYTVVSSDENMLDVLNRIIVANSLEK